MSTSLLLMSSVCPSNCVQIYARHEMAPQEREGVSPFVDSSGLGAIEEGRHLCAGDRLIRTKLGVGGGVAAKGDTCCG